MVKAGPRVDGLYFILDWKEAFTSGGDGCRDVVDHHLNYLDLILKAGGRWKSGADCLLKFRLGFEEVVVGGVCNSDEEDVVFGVEPNLCNQRLGQGSIDKVSEEEVFTNIGDRSTIPGDKYGPVSLSWCGRTGGGRLGFRGLPVDNLGPGLLGGR